MLRRLFILAAVVSLGLPAVRAQEGAASHAAVIQADTLPVLLERLERDPEDIDLLVEICSQYTMRSEFAAIHPYVSRLRRAGAAHDDERALMYADLFSGQSYLLAEGSDSTRIYLDRALIRGRQCEDPVALCRIYNALGIYAVSIETNYFGGIEYFLEAMKYARSASLNRFYLVAQCNLANTYYMRNDPAGLKYAEEVYRLGTEWGYDYLAFGGAVISAYMHYMLGDQNRALEYILRTLPDTDKFGYHTELYSLYANILHAQGDDAGAERYYLMALDHIDQKVVTAAVMTYLSYGTYLNDRGEYARAIPVLRQGIELSEGATTPCTAISFTCVFPRPRPRWAATARRWTISRATIVRRTASSTSSGSVRSTNCGSGTTPNGRRTCCARAKSTSSASSADSSCCCCCCSSPSAFRRWSISSTGARTRCTSRSSGSSTNS